ncbi:DUF1349 domain-containing protein [Amycolatopsis acidicola]|uniref:DUF1349 domain-containing protein n=1 Tax=Amycolatopsis acidicola TaxID=2596893 RepID=A0A5N0UQE4_9PSEU|nr:DUF1349 domain-containing protein [Amycolatopsis acidicola]KAA9153180.1 DUF1349 domain-containing protein [Amycolatopsis acidicola]
MSYSSSVPRGRDGFPQLFRAEWTKLRSVPAWVATIAAASVLTIGTAALVAAASTPDAPARTAGSLGQYADSASFLHRTMTGNGTVVARVVSQDEQDTAAGAGLMIRASADAGAPYAALIAAPGQGPRLVTDFATEATGSPAARWLRLTRTDALITGYQSEDGATWTQIGVVTVHGLGERVETGLFATAPGSVVVSRGLGGESIEEKPGPVPAVFDNVAVTPVQAQTLPPWSQPVADGPALTVRASGELGASRYAGDAARDLLSSIMIGLVVLVALAVFTFSAEARGGLLRTTFIAVPRRGPLLAAKAAALGTAAFAGGLVAALGAYLVGANVVRGKGIFVPSLGEPAVLRAALGSSLLAALTAVFGLGVAMFVRRRSIAIGAVLVLVLLPRIIGTTLPVSTAQWLERITPSAGFAIQETVQRYDSAIAPWAGLGVLALYAAAALGVGIWWVRRQPA